MLKRRVEKFQRVIKQSDVTRQRVEREYQKGILVRRDIEIVYEGLFLRAVVAFEDFLESVFFLALYDRSGKGSWGPLFGGNSKALRACVFGEKKYLDWLPFDRTLTRANLYLKSGKPFSLLSDGEKSKLSQVVTIRNAIAHSSNSAFKKFEREVIGSTAVPANERRPAGYLRGWSSVGMTRYQVYVQSLGGIAQRFV